MGNYNNVSDWANAIAQALKDKKGNTSNIIPINFPQEILALGTNDLISDTTDDPSLATLTTRIANAIRNKCKCSYCQTGNAINPQDFATHIKDMTFDNSGVLGEGVFLIDNVSYEDVLVRFYHASDNFSDGDLLTRYNIDINKDLFVPAQSTIALWLPYELYLQIYIPSASVIPRMYTYNSSTSHVNGDGLNEYYKPGDEMKYHGFRLDWQVCNNIDYVQIVPFSRILIFNDTEAEWYIDGISLGRHEKIALNYNEVSSSMHIYGQSYETATGYNTYVYNQFDKKYVFESPKHILSTGEGGFRLWDLLWENSSSNSNWHFDGPDICIVITDTQLESNESPWFNDSNIHSSDSYEGHKCVCWLDDDGTGSIKFYEPSTARLTTSTVSNCVTTGTWKFNIDTGDYGSCEYTLDAYTVNKHDNTSEESGDNCERLQYCADCQTVLYSKGYFHDKTSSYHAATCTDDAYTYYYCSNCGSHLGTSTYPNTATGHDWNDGVCETCGITCDHDYEYTNPQIIDCELPYYYDWKCKICDRIAEGHKPDDTTVVGHDWTDFISNGDGTHTRYCNREDCRATETEDCNWYEGSVTPPTCTESGYTTYYCTDCGSSVDEDPVEPIGHNYQYIYEEDIGDGCFTIYEQCEYCLDIRSYDINRY